MWKPAFLKSSHKYTCFQKQWVTGMHIPGQVHSISITSSSIHNEQPGINGVIGEMENNCATKKF